MKNTAKQFINLSPDWIANLENLFAHIGHRFGRIEMQQRALEYLVGLLSPLERKNGW